MFPKNPKRVSPLNLCGAVVVSLILVYQPALQVLQAAQVTSVDMLFLVDESGSMGGLHNFLNNQILAIDNALVGQGVTNNRFGLIGYGNTAQVPRQLDVGGAQFGSAAQFQAATGSLVTNGGTEDGYAAIHYGYSNYLFRNNVGVSFVLVTDEDRDTLAAGTYAASPGLDFNTIKAALQQRNIVFSGILSQFLYPPGTDPANPGGAQQALLMDGNGTVYFADGAGGTTTQANGVVGTGAGTTRTNYTDLALQLGGAVGNLNQVNLGGNTAQSFAEAFLAALVFAVQQGGVVIGPTTLSDSAHTPFQLAVALLLEAQAPGALQDVANALRQLGDEQAIRDALENVGGQLLRTQLSSALHAYQAQGSLLGSRFDTLHLGGSVSAQVDPTMQQRARQLAWEQQRDAYWNASVAEPAPADRSGEPAPGNLGFFALGSIADGNEDPHQGQLGNDQLTGSGSVGIDYRFAPQFVGGLAIGMTRNDTEFDDDSRMCTDVYTFMPYMTLSLPGNLFLDGAFGLGIADIASQRKLTVPGFEATAKGDTGGLFYSTHWRLVRPIRMCNFTLSPEAQIAYLDGSLDSYSEHGAGVLNLRVDDQRVRSLTSALGLSLACDTTVAKVPVTPFVRARWVHEYKNGDRNVSTAFAQTPGSSFVNPVDGADQNYFTAEVGASVLLRDSLTLYASYGTLLANADFSNHEIKFGVRMEF